MLHLFRTWIEKPCNSKGRLRYRWVPAYIQVTETGYILPALTYTEWKRQGEPFKRYETESLARIGLLNE